MSSSTATKRLYVGNLSDNVSKDDLEQLFGLKTTKYLEENCTVECAHNEKTGKSKGYAFITVPEGITHELTNLAGIEFWGKNLVIEEARTSDGAKPKGSGGRGRRGRGGRGGYQRRGGYRNIQMPQVAESDKHNLIDCGVNLTNPKFSRGTALEKVIAKAKDAGVSRFLVTGLTLTGSRNAVTMAKGREGTCFASIGIHPHFAEKEWKDGVEKEIRTLAAEKYVKAIGEVGLDKHRNYSNLDVQTKAFKSQVQIAIDLNKSLLVHERDAFSEVMGVLSEMKVKLPVVIHCFTGTADHIKEYVKKGYFIGVTGFVCKDKHGAALREAITAKILPLEKMILQSDAPYMVPNSQTDLDPLSKCLLDVCFQHNEPCTLSVVVKAITKCIHGSTDTDKVSAVARQLNMNAEKVFGKF